MSSAVGAAKLKELVGTLQVAAADVDKVTTLLRRKAENYFIPHFEQIRLKANRCVLAHRYLSPSVHPAPHKAVRCTLI